MTLFGWSTLGRLSILLPPSCRLVPSIDGASTVLLGFLLRTATFLSAREAGATLRIAFTLLAGNRVNSSGDLQVLPPARACESFQPSRFANFGEFLPSFLSKHGVPARLWLRTGSIHDIKADGNPRKSGRVVDPSRQGLAIRSIDPAPLFSGWNQVCKRA